ncbi:MAG: glycine cleavage system protein GcvH [Verrucomicrobiota bacterium]
MNLPESYKYTKSHEWIEVAEAAGTVGITDHAQNELSDVVFVELPEIGRTVEAGEAVAVVESVKAASDIYSPVSGEITAVNETLSNDPALVNSGAFTDGWLFKIKLSDVDELEALLPAGQYAKEIDS